MRLLLYSFLFLTLIIADPPDKIQDQPASSQAQVYEWLFPVGFQNESEIPAGFRKIQQAQGLLPVADGKRSVNRERNLSNRTDCELSYVEEGDAYYYLDSGAENDTLAVVFQPGGPCVVEEVYVQWFSSGTITAFAAEYGSASEISPDGDCYDIPRGSTNLSPVGQLLTTPTVNTIDGYVSEWSSAAQLDIGGSFTVSDPDNLNDAPLFVITIVNHAGNPEPFGSNNEVIGRTETYTWFGGPWNAESEGLWGNYHPQIELMMMVKVSYPWMVPPVVSLSQLSDTYEASGARVVRAEVYGLNAGYCEPDTTYLDFFVGINGETQYSMPLSELTPVDVDADGNGVYEFALEYGADVGDFVSYWAEGSTGVQFSSSEYDFQILNPVNPDADLLIVGSSEDEYYFGGFEAAASQNGYGFESWDIHQRNGIDASVINWGWPHILIMGSGGAVLPVVGDDSDPGFGSFLQTDGNLMLVDQDWFDGHQLESFPEELTFIPGDPAFDWFGIQGAVSNPDDDGDISNGGTGDTFVVSQLGELPDLELNHGIYGTTNRADYLIPADAEPLYRGTLSDEVMGVRYVDGISKRAFFSFMADAAVDSLADGSVYYTQEFFDFFSAMMDWFHVQMGDITGDSVVDVLDIVMMVGHIMGDLSLNLEQIQVADMNGDGAIDVQDAVLIVEVILGG